MGKEKNKHGHFLGIRGGGFFFTNFVVQENIITF